jgi:glycosyltransferase involved in cell wall biosynthesis
VTRPAVPVHSGPHAHGPNRPRVSAILDIALGLGKPSGFSGRYYHLLRAIGSSFRLDIVDLRTADEKALGGPPDGIGYDRYLREALPPNPVHQIRWRRRVHSLFGLAPAMAYPTHVQLLTRLWLSDRPDLVLVFLPRLAQLIFDVPRDVPCICVLEEELWLDRLGLVPELSAWKRFWVTRSEDLRTQLMLKRVAKRASLIVAISDQEKDALCQYLPREKVVVLPHGIDVEYFRPLADSCDPDFDIAIIGDMSSRRNGEGVVRFARALEKEATIGELWGLEGPTLALVGRCPSPEVLALNSDRVKVLGEVEDVRPFYARARVIAVPATQGTGVKTAILQAWAAGRPVVATELAGRGLPVREGENILLTDSPESLAVAALALAQDADRAYALAGSGLETVRSERDMRRLALRFLDMCREVAASKPGLGEATAHAQT